jgi:GDP-mannose 6-dehydrogenase
LPKDLRGLRFFARTNDVATPLLDGILGANENQIAEAFRMVEATGKRRVALLGLTFKDATDDMRESPFVELAERLVGKGYELRIYDPAVTHSHLVGANRHFILGRIPHLFGLLDDDLSSVVRAADVVVVGRSPRDRGGSYLASLLRPGQAVIDLEGRDPALRTDGYAGICW